jgi:2-polyprenyl-6-methoxyphenol hydroxylase-like FAD-dependent oxidoreductase
MGPIESGYYKDLGLVYSAGGVSMTQVVIIGAGPTGATLGMLLAQRGISVQLVEASRSFRRIFRGEALMPSGLEAIAAMGLADVVDRIPHQRLDGWEFTIEGRSIFQVDEPMELGGESCTLISQPEFLEAVLERAAGDHFEFIQGSAVQDLLWEDDRVSGVKLADGRQLMADLVIGADGRNSIVRQKANLSLNENPKTFDVLWFKLPTSPDFVENRFHAVLRDRDGFGVFQSSEGNLQIGWSLHDDDPDWKTRDWPEVLAAAAPDWLAGHLRSQKDAIDRPLLLSVVAGCCPLWQVPGLLLLGDAAHPMSPIRAQGINMALRDVVAAANGLVPVLLRSRDLGAIDAVLPRIQADREPEILAIQGLQQAEVAQGELMRNNPVLRHLVSRMAPLLRPGIRYSWIRRQLKMRRGLGEVVLRV